MARSPFGIDHTQILLTFGRTDIGFKCLDLCPADKNVGSLKLGVAVIHCEDARIPDEYRHGAVSRSAGPGGSILSYAGPPPRLVQVLTPSIWNLDCLLGGRIALDVKAVKDAVGRTAARIGPSH